MLGRDLCLTTTSTKMLNKSLVGKGTRHCTQLTAIDVVPL